MKNLYLDDFRIPEDSFKYTYNTDYLKLKWDIVRNYDEFVAYIEKNGMPDLISFDHDLADEHYAPEEHWEKYDEWKTSQNFKEKTGFDCAKWLIDFCIDNKANLPKIYVHSMNPVGAENIEKIFLNYIKFTEKNG